MNFDNNIKEHILNSIAEGVVTVDKEFRINYINKAAEKILGYSQNEVIGKFCKYIFRSGECFNNCPVAQALISNESVKSRNYNVFNSKNELIPLKINSSVLYNDKEVPIGGILTFSDDSEIQKLKRTLLSNQFEGIIASSKKMHEIFELIREIKDSDAPVLIQGESGTGKELIANAIQTTGNRNLKPFVKVNCAVFPDSLLPSELFGHIRGAFTDAHTDRKGRFELADSGTIFLDEIAEMSLQMQLQLLRVIQEGTFERIGESVTRKVDVRIIAATNLDLKSAMQTNKFRDDLFYRLNVIPIQVPPLRERKEDIIPLLNYFLGKFSLLYKKNILEVDDRIMDILLNYDWPGNIRELENVLEYAFIRTSEGLLRYDKLPAHIIPGNKIENKKPADSEYDELLSTLKMYRWNKTLAAKHLGIGRTTLWRKIRELNLE